jgi:hypothetical protein
MEMLKLNDEEHFTNLFAGKLPGLLPLLSFLRPRGWLIVLLLLLLLFLLLFHLLFFLVLIVFLGTVVGFVFRSLRLSVSLRVFVRAEFAEAEAGCEL